MKRISCLFLMITALAFLGGACKESKSTSVKVVFYPSGEGNIFFQPEGKIGYDKVLPDSSGRYEFVAELSEPVYYRYMDTKQRYTSVYLMPGDQVEIHEGENGISFKGDRVAENDFLKDHVFIAKAPEGVELYSREWVDVVSGDVSRVIDQLKQSGLSPEFIRQQTLVYQYAYYNQMLMGPTFSASFMKTPVDLSDDYYDFLKDLKFDDPMITRVPKWFTFMLEAFERMEKEGSIEVSPDRFMEIHAGRIGDEKVRSAFLVNLLDLTLQKGYSDNYPAYVEGVRPLITDTLSMKKLPALEERYQLAREANKSLLRGMKAPEFKAVDLKGKTYSSADFKGKVQVLDFWFTGCIPCRAEMPYMEKIAEEMKGQPIAFLSMSLDTGEELMALWREMVKDKHGAELQLNVPGGFKSDLVKEYLMRGVPRIVIIDQEGNIVDAYAQRPSDPKLKMQLERLVKEL